MGVRPERRGTFRRLQSWTRTWTCVLPRQSSEAALETAMTQDGQMRSAAETERTFHLTADGMQVTPPGLNDTKGGRPNQVSTTKFTPATWLPKSLYYQFQRMANVYFLFICVIVCMPFSPKKWMSFVPAFVAVLLWTALKDAYEDVCRHREDERENGRMCWKYNLETGAFEEVAWREVLAGDLVFVLGDGAFPADLLLLQASGGSEAFISTVNLDGETNLKERRPPQLCGALISRAPTLSRRFSLGSHGHVKAEQQEAAHVARLLVQRDLRLHMGQPEPLLADVRGRLDLGGEECSCGEVNFLPRGCVLRNTVWVLAIAAYVGDDTKTRLNRVRSAPKVSNMQRYLNMSVRGILGALFLMCLYLATMASILNPKASAWPIMFFKYIITLYQVVPISLYVVFEMLKLLLSYQVGADPQLVDPESKAGAAVRCADLIEELGQVGFVFSDKTGTLTANEMVFARSCVASRDLGDFRRSAPSRPGWLAARHNLKDPSHALHVDLDLFYTCLAVCHSVQVEDDPDAGPFPANLRYSGMSPDEVALVQAACDVDMVLTKRIRQPGSAGPEMTLLDPNGKERRFQVLREIEFNSDRKRMSVVAEHEGEYWCVTKGADNVMIELLDAPLDEATQQSLLSFSQQGLRTLVVAMKKVEPIDLERWETELKAAEGLTDSSRNAKVAEVSARLEQDLRLVGVTAVEDRLQDGVPEAIDTVKRAGVKVWVLTGDKTETAVDIARSCALFGRHTTLAFGTDAQSAEDMVERLRAAKAALASSSDSGLVLDGRTIKYALSSDEGCTLIYELGLASRSCVCCRLSPMQKRQLVELVREKSPETITLAIGDGANDVPMIEGAHIGIGIRGKEGAQAVQVSDIAISQFRFLVPLLLCHGSRAYRRVALFLSYYLYKNIALTWSDVIWAHQSGFGGNIAFPEYITMGFNVLFTSWHILPVVGFDKGVSDQETCAHPELYLDGPRRALFNPKVLTTWMLYSMWHGAIAWLVPNLMFGGRDEDCHDNWSCYHRPGSSFWLASVTSFSLVVFLVNGRLLLSTLHPFRWTATSSSLLTTLLFLAWLFALGCSPALQVLQKNIAGLPPVIFKDCASQKALVIVFVAGMAVDSIDKVIRRLCFPTVMDQLMNQGWKAALRGEEEATPSSNFAAPRPASAASSKVRVQDGSPGRPPKATSLGRSSAAAEP